MSRMFTVINEEFECLNCKTQVKPLAQGSCRNHCPNCFHSLHLDINPGDRAANCGGMLVPIGFEEHKKKGHMVIHRCQACGHVGRNKLAFDDPVQPDSFDEMVKLIQKFSYQQF
ncbi:RNHCP domain-containing protein [Tumebacillus algifaecis]|uniref:RNHCP domain-containing protein n=1 Tax=Tumebacillus algifaecis TaxID=1214604 RepID=A0A223D0A0_9BACL|nr:RNHCP domain-containing protein [Tumebacillus algifaecis]ASS75030.1 RNHCP domain-containing protein [Tumebacillus algifaecis]